MSSVRTGSGPRRLIAGLALAVVVVMVPLSVAGAWLRGTVTDTDGYVAQTSRMLEVPEVRAQLATALSNELVDQIGTQGASAALDKMLAGTKIPQEVREAITSSTEGTRAKLEQTINALAQQTVTTPAFAGAWRGANRALHQQVVAQLEAPTPSDPTAPVTLDLGKAATVLREELAASGFPGVNRLPQVDATYPVTTASELEPARRVYQFVDTWAPLAPWLALGALVVGLACATRRLRALGWTALLSGAALLVCLPLLAVARSVLVEVVDSGALGGVIGLMVENLTEPLGSRLLQYGLVLVVAGVLVLVAATVLAVRRPGGSRSRRYASSTPDGAS